MSVAPMPQLAAALEVLHLAAILARMLGYEGHKDGLPPEKCDRLADLMDAIHEIPLLLVDWERCDESLLRGILGDYDKRWSSGLLDTYDRIVAERTREQHP
jgi:hypothetical protein